jgi:hypothetical protein
MGSDPLISPDAIVPREHVAAWEGPPLGLVGWPLGLVLTLISDADVGVAITDLVAFPSGFTCCLRAERRIARYEDAWLRGLANPAREGPMIGLTVQFPDGTAAHNTDESPPSTDVTSPVITPIGGQGSDAWQIATYYWVSPLPTSGPVTFSVHAQSLALPEATATVGGEVFVAAAERALPIWRPRDGS